MKGFLIFFLFVVFLFSITECNYGLCPLMVKKIFFKNFIINNERIILQQKNKISFFVNNIPILLVVLLMYIIIFFKKNIFFLKSSIEAEKNIDQTLIPLLGENNCTQ